MTETLIDKFKYLPDELIHIIINYTDAIVYRHGMYINRLNKYDKRFCLINKIPRPVRIGSHKILLRLTRLNYNGYFLCYDMYDNLCKVNIRFFNGFDKYYEIKSNDTYLFDVNNKWRKITHYIM